MAVKKAKKKELTRPRKKIVFNNGLDNAFRLVILASKRAKELYSGAKSLIETNSIKPCLVALEEIKSTKIKYKDIK